MIRFHDKTEYDQKVATLVTDYTTCIDGLGNLSIEAINGNSNSKNLKVRFNKLPKEKGLRAYPKNR